MSAPITKSQMAFELPKLSYIDTHFEEPAAVPVSRPAVKGGFAAWIAARVAAYRAWRQQSRAVGELTSMSDRELLDVGLNRGDFARIFDEKHNHDLRFLGRVI
jgi:uncharacterized protein YjiS (DUF1127 family)